MSRLRVYLKASAVAVGVLTFAFVGSAHYESSASHPTHVISAGEALASIAAAHGVSEEQIRRANGLDYSGFIYAGNTLRLEGSGFVIDLDGTDHLRLAEPDTLAHIASHRGLTAHELAHLNDMDAESEIPVGTTVHVPKTWVCPVADARFFNDWGFPRSGGRYHTGTDLFAARGTPVRAPVPGTVRHVTGSAGGNQFVLTGDDGVTYLGSHMDRFGASGSVAAGDVVGYVGDSGNALGSEPHLHFQVHPNGDDAENPYPTLERAGC